MASIEQDGLIATPLVEDAYAHNHSGRSRKKANQENCICRYCYCPSILKNAGCSVIAIGSNAVNADKQVPAILADEKNQSTISSAATAIVAAAELKRNTAAIAIIQAADNDDMPNHFLFTKTIADDETRYRRQYNHHSINDNQHDDHMSDSSCNEIYGQDDDCQQNEENIYSTRRRLCQSLGKYRRNYCLPYRLHKKIGGIEDQSLLIAAATTTLSNQLNTFNPLTPPASPPLITTTNDLITTSLHHLNRNVSAYSSAYEQSSYPNRVVDSSHNDGDRIESQHCRLGNDQDGKCNNKSLNSNLIQNTCSLSVADRSSSSSNQCVYRDPSPSSYYDFTNDQHWDSDETLSSVNSDISDDDSLTNTANRRVNVYRPFAMMSSVNVQRHIDFIDCLLARQRYRRTLLQRKIQRIDKLIERRKAFDAWQYILDHKEKINKDRFHLKSNDLLAEDKDIICCGEEMFKSGLSDDNQDQSECKQDGIYQKLLARLYDNEYEDSVNDSGNGNNSFKIEIDHVNNGNNERDRKGSQNRKRKNASNASSTNCITTNRSDDSSQSLRVISTRQKRQPATKKCLAINKGKHRRRPRRRHVSYTCNDFVAIDKLSSLKRIDSRRSRGNRLLDDTTLSTKDPEFNVQSHMIELPPWKLNPISPHDLKLISHAAQMDSNGQAVLIESSNFDIEDLKSHHGLNDAYYEQLHVAQNDKDILAGAHIACAKHISRQTQLLDACNDKDVYAWLEVKDTLDEMLNLIVNNYTRLNNLSINNFNSDNGEVRKRTFKAVSFADDTDMLVDNLLEVDIEDKDSNRSL